MVQLKKVVSDDVYDSIHSYVEAGDKAVETYEDMVEVTLSMIKDGYCFVMDRDILRDAMESLTYMYRPSDEMNRDRLVQQFADDGGDESDEEDSVCGDMGGSGGDMDGLDMMKMMQMMGMNPPSGQPVDEDVVVTKEGDEDVVVTKEGDEETAKDVVETPEEELVPAEKVD